MQLKIISTTFIVSICFLSLTAQTKFLRTKEGRPILDRNHLVYSCLKTLHKDNTDKLAVSICECQISKLDRHFTYSQFKQHTTDGIIDLTTMIKHDSSLNKSIQECYSSTGQTTLLEAEGFEDDYIEHCVKNLRENTNKKLDSTRLQAFCRCQLELVKSKKIKDEDMRTLSDPNSLFFYEMIYNCGDPFNDDIKNQNNWNQNSKNDIQGPQEDTLNILTINGMSYIKARIGNLLKVWLFDTGSSDLVINKEMEGELKNEGLINQSNYLGIGQYEMANGLVDTCRKYMISNLKVGNFTVNNIVVAVTEKGKKIIIGRSFLNKFEYWQLENNKQTLILSK